jgi:hemerythrin-like domain-containing protein
VPAREVANVSAGEQKRLIAWNRELLDAHERLRAALRLARDSFGADRQSTRADLALYCHGFCAALSGHHTSEDAELFPELSVRYPALRSTIATLKQDHDMIASLLADLDHALTGAASTEELTRRLDGVAAIMESHFRYEERQLLDLLATLEFDADPQRVMGDHGYLPD